MVDVVLGEDEQRALGREPAIDERLRQPIDEAPRVPVGDAAPPAAGGRGGALPLHAIREEHPIRRDLGPVPQPIDDVPRDVPERVRRRQDQRAVGAAIDQNAGGREGGGGQGHAPMVPRLEGGWRACRPSAVVRRKGP